MMAFLYLIFAFFLVCIGGGGVVFAAMYSQEEAKSEPGSFGIWLMGVLWGGASLIFAYHAFGISAKLAGMP